MAPRVSVIIPTYNRSSIVPGAIEAAQHQTYSRFGTIEVVVVDDGSCDETGKVIASRFPGAKYFRTDNSGLVCARIAGLAASSGELVCFCDDDDRFRPTKIERQVALFEAYPKMGMCFTNFEYSYGGIASGLTKFDEAPEGFFDYPKAEVSSSAHVTLKSIYPRVVRFQPTLASTTMFRRCFLERIGGLNAHFTRSPAEDYEFLLRAAHYPPVGVCHEPLVEISRHGDNMSGSDLQNLIANVQILEHALRTHPAGVLYRKELEAEIVRRAYAACVLAFEKRDWASFHRMQSYLHEASCGRAFSLKAAIASFPVRAVRNYLADVGERLAFRLRRRSIRYDSPSLQSLSD